MITNNSRLLSGNIHDLFGDMAISFT